MVKRRIYSLQYLNIFSQGDSREKQNSLYHQSFTSPTEKVKKNDDDDDGDDEMGSRTVPWYTESTQKVSLHQEQNLKNKPVQFIRRKREFRSRSG